MYITMSIYEVFRGSGANTSKNMGSEDDNVSFRQSMDTQRSLKLHVIHIRIVYENVHPRFKRHLMSHLNLATHRSWFPCELRSTVVCVCTCKNSMTVFGRSVSIGQPKPITNNTSNIQSSVLKIAAFAIATGTGHTIQ